MKYNHQLEEEHAHAHFKYTENKHEKTNYEFRVGLLLAYKLKIIPLVHVGYEMIKANEARIIVLLKTPPK